MKWQVEELWVNKRSIILLTALHKKVHLRINIWIDAQQDFNLLACNSTSFTNLLEIKFTVHIDEHIMLGSKDQLIQKLSIPIEHTPATINPE